MSYMNRMGNSKNPYQTQAKRVLCVCSAGLLRSPTAANVLHQEYGHNTRAAGSVKEYALVTLDPVLCEWADEIVFMEQTHYELAKAAVGDALDSKKIIVLAVPDAYEWNDSELRKIIKKQYDDVAIMEKAHV